MGRLLSGLTLLGTCVSTSPSFGQSANQTRAEALDSDRSEKAYILGCSLANAAGQAVCDELRGSHSANERLERDKQIDRQAAEQKKEDERQRQYQRDAAAKGGTHLNRDKATAPIH
jgi:hypothetical protein